MSIYLPTHIEIFISILNQRYGVPEAVFFEGASSDEEAEMIGSTQLVKPLNLWALGCIFYFILTGKEFIEQGKKSFD